MEDILPYTCLFNPCLKNAIFFNSRTKWINHMREHHGVQKWICDDCPVLESNTTFPTFRSLAQWTEHRVDWHGEADGNPTVEPETIKVPLLPSINDWAHRQKPATTKDEKADRIQELFVCHDCPGLPKVTPITTFDSIELWSKHKHSEHNMHYSELDMLVGATLAERKVLELMQCPLDRGCKMSLEEDEHIADHLRNFTLNALPWHYVSDINEADNEFAPELLSIAQSGPRIGDADELISTGPDEMIKGDSPIEATMRETKLTEETLRLVGGGQISSARKTERWNHSKQPQGTPTLHKVLAELTKQQVVSNLASCYLHMAHWMPN